MSVVPKLVIVGAPRCGTTSLFDWLSNHPSTVPSVPKETYYLTDSNLPFARHSRHHFAEDGLTGYARFFPNGATSGQLPFEATTRYLCDPVAQKVLFELDPQPHIVVVLREPGERVHSSFSYVKNNQMGIAKELTFPMYVDLALAGRYDQLARYALDAEGAYMLRHDIDESRYHLYLRGWVEELDAKGKLHVLLFEDLTRDPADSMRRLAARIALDPSCYDDFQFRHLNRSVSKASSIHALLRRVVAPLLPQSQTRRRLQEWYHRLLDRPADAVDSAADESARRRLSATFAADNLELGKLLGRDLAEWNP